MMTFRTWWRRLRTRRLARNRRVPAYPHHPDRVPALLDRGGMFIDPRQTPATLTEPSMEAGQPPDPPTRLIFPPGDHYNRPHP